MANGFAPSGAATYAAPYNVVPGTLTIDDYPVGGYAPTAAAAKISTVRRANTAARSSLGYLLAWNAATGKVQAFRSQAAGGSRAESWPDVKGGIFAAITADAAAAALNDAAVLALTDATVTTAGGLAHAAGLTAGITNPNAIDAEVAGRNVVVAQAAVGAATTWAALSALRVTGTASDGTAQVEDIPLQTTEIADTKFRLAIGTKAFATVTNLRLIRTDTAASRAGPASSQISVGIGTIFGLRGAILAEADVDSVRKDGAAVAAATYVATADPSQIDMGADVADNVDILVVYDAQPSDLVTVEADEHSNVGTAFLEVIGD